MRLTNVRNLSAAILWLSMGVAACGDKTSQSSTKTEGSSSGSESKGQKEKECKAATALLKDIDISGTTDPDAANGAILVWDAKAAELEVTDSTLSKKLTEYRELVKAMGKLIAKGGMLSKQVQATTDPAALKTINSELEATGKHVEESGKKVKTLSDDINAYCK